MSGFTSQNLFTAGVSSQAWYVDTNSSDLGTIQISKAAGASGPADFLQCCIINNIVYNREVANQVEPTTGGNIYINFFGDKPTQYSVSGIAFDTPDCSGKATNTGKSLIDFYDSYKLNWDTGKDTKTTATQVTLTTYNTLSGGNITYVGILVSMFLDFRITPAGVRQYTFSFKFIAIK